jgi:hypothetical protein
MDGTVLSTLRGKALYTAYGIHAIFDLTKQVSWRRKASELYSTAVEVQAVTTK